MGRNPNSVELQHAPHAEGNQMGMELILGVAVVLLLGATLSLWMGRAEKTRDLRLATDELNEAKRQTQNQTRKADEVAGKLEKSKSEFNRVQSQLKDLKKQHHSTREQLEKMKAANRRSSSSEDTGKEARRAQARVEELEAQVTDLRGKLENLNTTHQQLKDGKEARLADQVAQIAGQVGVERRGCS